MRDDASRQAVHLPLRIAKVSIERKLRLLQCITIIFSRGLRIYQKCLRYQAIASWEPSNTLVINKSSISLIKQQFSFW